MNKLYYGDCLTIMQDYMKAGSVDLIYLDPPFKSERQYNSIYKDETGRPLPEQVDAFCDTWELDDKSERDIRHMPLLMLESGLDDDAVQLWKLWMHALRYTRPRLLAYLSYMTVRLIQMRVVLNPTGSIYLHCDPYASHYIKAVMDAIFGHDNFRNEITWQRTESHNTAERYGNIADTILYYSKGKHPTWNAQYSPYGESQLKRYRHVDDQGRRYRLENLTAPRPDSESGKFEWRGTKPGPTRGWGYRIEQLEKWWDEGRIQVKRDSTPRMDGLKVYLDDAQGKPLQNIWTDIPRIPNTSSERMGYATQKPRALLERIIMASSNEGEVVLDPFAGCATTLEAAHELNRQWIGIDIAFHAVNRVIHNRLRDRCGLVEGKDYEVDGVPLTLEAARDLWERDKYHFQQWAIEKIDGFVTAKRTGDRGIDGRLYFYLPHNDRIQNMVMEVKGGKNVNITVVRDLRGVLENEDALMAGLIVMEPLGAAKERNFKKYMAEAGDLEVHGMSYPRMQMLTVDEILDGKRFNTPNVAAGRREAQPRLPV